VQTLAAAATGWSKEGLGSAGTDRGWRGNGTQVTLFAQVEAGGFVKLVEGLVKQGSL
jgi:hypothetical protein